ncbi:Bug family tripartite tricarboxylate transporter substrate binding protein [Roseomonas marmotae]|uniref:Tripartite tricarboxylate transporter substrate binding protein n=1 Tax=Roseomonas marmotae TaxID=2768161 RepID=A0ABS3KAR2_9PROT|nr:tripartite tricarboxylate transporter substrate binding protein [Roseomonas marmotae]MBO1074527.1 tripartite tricarboxylate transporter substrate binding protein [Roseomonas marmotae]QTI81561.1 tripartite tricarboxylate transporter substrate binding protein [Roseomonas marmotae]
MPLGRVSAIHRPPVLTRRHALAAAGLGLLAAPAAAQQGWPGQNARIIVPFAPGGTADIPARIIADHLTRHLGRSFVVENRSGAGGALGIRTVAQATDGHTLLHSTSAVAILPALQRDPGFDPLTDLTPITMTAAAPILLLVRADSPFRDLRSFLVRARAQPGRVSFGSSGVGTTVHLAGELLRARAGLDLLHVPYRGSAPSATALLSGETDSAFLSPVEAIPHLRAGRMRVLANAGRQRATLAPDAAAMVEEVPDYDGIQLWFGLFGPRDLPVGVVASLMRELAPLRRDSVLAERMTELGAETLLDGPEALASRMRAEVPLWKSIVEQAGIPRE